MCTSLRSSRHNKIFPVILIDCHSICCQPPVCPSTLKHPRKHLHYHNHIKFNIIWLLVRLVVIHVHVVVICT